MTTDYNTGYQQQSTSTDQLSTSMSQLAFDPGARFFESQQPQSHPHASTGLQSQYPQQTPAWSTNNSARSTGHIQQDPQRGRGHNRGGDMIQQQRGQGRGAGAVIRNLSTLIDVTGDTLPIEAATFPVGLGIRDIHHMATSGVGPFKLRTSKSQRSLHKPQM
jgi:hypothetical protein